MIPLFLLSLFLVSLLQQIFVPRWTRTRYQADAWPWDARIAKAARVGVLVGGMCFGQSVPVIQGLVGFILYWMGELLILQAMAANPYYTAALRIPPVRVTWGPYRYLQHPGYAGGVLAALGTWMAMPSALTLACLVAFLLCVAYRIERENKLFQ